MLNARHKVILFITLVLTGSTLLAGATVAQALGILILGIALAWLVGSKTTSIIGHYAIDASGKTWPWVRATVLMSVAGGLLVGVARVANSNAFLVAVTIGCFGIACSK